MRAIVIATLVACLLPRVANAAEWRVTLTTISGNATTCGVNYGTKFMVLEDGNTLVLTNMTKRHRHMTIPLQPDGSAAGEFTVQLSTRAEQARVKVPAGSGQRVFEYLLLQNACGVRVDPA